MIRTKIQNWLLENKIEGRLEHPADKKFGDFSVRTGSEVKLTKNNLVDKVEFVSGFTNIYLNPELLMDRAKKIKNGEFRKDLSQIGKNKSMVIDYSAPNIAKAFGIGHLRSTNIGQAIYNLYEILGWKCIGDNHLGDWGTQFGKLIVAIKKWGEMEVDKMTVEDLERLYVKFHQEAKKDESLVEEGRNWFLRLEKGDAEARSIWQKCVEISLKEFNKIYDLLGVKIDYAYGESFYEDKMAAVVEMLVDKNLIKESQGAKIIEFENMPPAMVEKSNGTTTYFTRDLATIKYRVETWNPDLMIYEIGADQSLHCRQLFEAARKLGFTNDFYHVAHGLIRWEGGKFSTRKGETIHLSEVIDRAIKEAKKIAPNNSQEQIKAVAIGAIKFNDLAQDPKKDIVFDWKRVMSMEGNSGPYLQYTYARCKSVINKKQDTKNKIQKKQSWNEEEMNLLREFYKFEEKIIEAADRFAPSVVAEYLLNLARSYNEFYAKNRIIGEKEESRRLFLTESTASILKQGLELLGIETVEKM